MGNLLNDVRALAGTIGPRGTGTPGEKAAAEYVSERLKELGIYSEKHDFPSVTSQNAFPIAISLMAVLATAIYPVGWGFTRWLAVALSLCAGWSLWQTIRNDFNPISLLLSKVTSQNVEARLQPARVTTRRVVLLAHLDTNRCRLVWQAMSVRSLEPMTWLTLSIPILMSIFYIMGAIWDNMLWWWLSLPLAAYELGSIVTLIRDDLTPYSPGAHDNAASIAVVLEVARRLSFAPLQFTEVWTVFDGAEETDHAGVLDLLRRHGEDLREALFFGLEGLGSGDLVYLTREGICTYYRPTADLLSLAESVACKHPELQFLPTQMVMEDDVRSLRGRGYHAIGIAGRDPETGILPHWHRQDDTPDTVSEVTLIRAVDIICALMCEFESTKDDR